MKDIVRRALLLDYYGALLTDKQRETYEWYYQHDLSLGEISEEAQVSRNAVYDLISRVDEKLERYDKALDLIAEDERSLVARDELAAELRGWLASCGESLSEDAKEEFKELIRRIYGL